MVSYAIAPFTKSFQRNKPQKQPCLAGGKVLNDINLPQFFREPIAQLLQYKTRLFSTPVRKIGKVFEEVPTFTLID